MIWTIKPFLISDVEPGMILGRPILSEDGTIVLSENTVLTQAMLHRLKEWGISSLYIKEAKQESVSNAGNLASEQRQFSQKHSQFVKVLKAAFERARYFKEVPIEQINEIAEQSIRAVMQHSSVISLLKSIRSTDDYTFRHCVNVGIISGVLSKWLGLSGETLKEVVLTGLLHDIGKTQIPLEILNKPGKLLPEEQDIMQEHATFGYELIKDVKKLPQGVLLGVWQHHERLDGAGYPFGISGREISTYARIVTVADIYDAMTSNRVYQKAVTPFKVVEDIFSEMFNRIDPAVSIVFLNNLKDSVIGYMVRLSDGSEAKVIYMEKNRRAQPVVKVGDGQFIDLEKRKDVQIVEIISTTPN